MNTIKKYFKVVAVFCATLIFFQGCTVYNSTSVTLQEASKTNSKVRVEKNSGKRLKYSKIVLLNDTIFNNYISFKNGVHLILFF